MKQETKKKRDELISNMKFNVPPGFIVFDHYYLTPKKKDIEKAKKRDEAVLMFYTAGYSQSNIARFFRISRQRVNKIIKKQQTLKLL
jgi:DNA invertase Pin-like site-specific DNA recombinase